MADNLVIVESPAKAKTIEKYLGKDYIVKSSYGHIRDLAKKELGINVEKGFEPEYIISEDKKKIVSELKKYVKDAKVIWLASDEDREGEAIAWHLKQTLNLDKKDTKRIVFNEITKQAILHAVENPRDIDINLVNAQQARRILDRIVGYEISPILWKKVKPSLSAGRVQSVAVRLIVEREQEIKEFTPVSYYKVSGIFATTANSNKHIINANLNNKFDDEKTANDFLKVCSESMFEIGAIETKPSKQSAQPPFTTSTLQQEAARKLGFSVSQTMLVAQQLYEQGLITYMRTDSVNLSSFALEQAKNEIIANYGEKYLKIRNYTTKTKGAQEAHEAIRPTNLANKEIKGDSNQKRLYNLIWKRMIASQMSDAKIEKTTITINISKDKSNKFVCQGEVILFDGFLKIYNVSVDEDDIEQNNDGNSSKTLPKLTVGEKVLFEQIKANQSFTTQMPRYNEATLVKKMEDLGIGRPSTYAPTISTIQKRDYVEKQNSPSKQRDVVVLLLNDDNKITKTIEKENYGKEVNKLLPTDIGTIVNQFLITNFKDIVDYNFTADVEKQFDKIAQGKQDWHKMIKDFYTPFAKEVEFTEQNSEKQKGTRLLGVDNKTKKNVYARIGRYGSMIQIGETSDEEKPKFAALKKNQSISTITLQEALSLFDLPRTLGEYKQKDVIVSVGRFGAYIKWGDKNVSLPKTLDPYTVEIETCKEVIDKKVEADKIKEELSKDLPKTIVVIEDKPVELKYGRFGLYLSYNEKNYRIPKDIDAKTITSEQATAIVSGKAKTTVKPLKTFSSGAEVLHGRFGEYIKYNGKNYRIPKGKTYDTLTEDEVKKIIEK
ncbi:MAG: type I DNA topoisomerase [Bacteroidales bacterium]|jgi:DNA topoisomerase-1|nr:type I DNA topoisomerase [Bacteroidales bacterium]